MNMDKRDFDDLIAMGVIDPAKVTRLALQDAASIAGLLITAEAAIVDAPDRPAADEPEGATAAAP